jgi:hypothetical protein
MFVILNNTNQLASKTYNFKYLFCVYFFFKLNKMTKIDSLWLHIHEYRTNFYKYNVLSIWTWHNKSTILDYGSHFKWYKSWII